MKKISLFTLILVAFFTSCQKPELAGTDPTGEGLVGFSLRSPSSGTNLGLNAATPNASVEITWGAAIPGLNTAPTYTWVAALKSVGNFKTPFVEILSDNAGKATKLTLSFKQLDDALKAKGIADAAKVDLIWTVRADNGSTQILAQNVFNLTVTRFSEGASPFILLGPVSSANNIEINPSSTTDNFKFNWTKSTPAKTTSPIKYRVMFYKDDASMTPVFSALSNNNGTDTLLTVNYKAFSDSLVKYGYTDFSQVARLKWNVTATSGTWIQTSDYTNQFNVVRLVRMFVVGSMTGWDINAPWELVADKASSRLGKVFYSYVRFAANDEFKFVKEVGNWGSAYGTTGGSSGSFTTGFNQGDNFKITTAGIYRITIDLGTNMAYVQQKQVGLVGNMQGWNASSPTFGGLVGARNKFIIISNTAATDEFKFHEGPEWDNGAPNKARWWGKGASDGLLDVDGNGPNLVAGFTPRTRAIWDASNPQQVRYELSSAAEMRIVGDGMQGVNAWDPGASPQMTYIGNGRWQLRINLVAGKDIKFLAGNAWGAFDYEDNGDNGTAGTTINRKIKWDGGDNFKTPATSGSYLITLDEHTQTVTITP
jgi:hypothetical protein